MSVGGSVAPGFERVAEAFERNFASAASSAPRSRPYATASRSSTCGAGVAEPGAGGRPWARGHAAADLLRHEGPRRAVPADAGRPRASSTSTRRSARYWPEFAAQRQGARSRSPSSPRTARALPGRARAAGDGRPDRRPRGWRRCSPAQPPEDDPRAAAIYHALTYGWLCGELVRRVDGRSVGRFFAEEVAAPLGLELWIGLPAELEPRVATLGYAADWGCGPRRARRRLARRRAAAAPCGPTRRSFPPVACRGTRAPSTRAEIPGANAIGTARSIARLYGCLARGGELDGVRLLSAGDDRAGRRELSRVARAAARASRSPSASASSCRPSARRSARRRRVRPHRRRRLGARRVARAARRLLLRDERRCATTRRRTRARRRCWARCSRR